MKLVPNTSKTDTLNAGPSGGILPFVVFCCLVIVVVGMGLKLPWFRREMRLGSRASTTAASSSQRGLTARVTNMPSQGVFRRLSFENITVLAPPQPPRKEIVRPKSTPDPQINKKKETRPPSLPAPAVKSKAKTITAAPPPIKTKVAPPTRRNPNAIIFNSTSSAAKPVKSNPARGSSAPAQAANPMLQAMASNADNDFNELFSPPNGHAFVPVSRSPKPASKKAPIKDPKVRNPRKVKEKKAPIFAKMSPKVEEPPSPPPVSIAPEVPAFARMRYSSGSEEEGDGTLTFRLPDPPSRANVQVQHSFLHMNYGGDSDECDA